jgi:hypothetical protein
MSPEAYQKKVSVRLNKAGLVGSESLVLKDSYIKIRRLIESPKDAFGVRLSYTNAEENVNFDRFKALMSPLTRVL